MRKILLIAILFVLMACPVWAADKTVTVAESGGDYTTLQAAITGEVAENANLVTMDGVLNIAISGAWTSADTTAVTVNGFTTDATHYVNIYTTGAARHSGVWSTTAYRLETGTTAITISDNNVRVNGLQVKVTITTTESHGFFINVVATGNAIHISNCIIAGDLSGAGATIPGSGIYSNDADSNITAYNNIIYDWKNGALLCYGIRSSIGVASSVYNNTIIDCQYGIRGGTNQTVASNNIVKGSGNTNAYHGTFLTGSDNNSTDGTDTDAGGFTSQTFTFDNETLNNFHLDEDDTGAMSDGKNLSAIFTTDIDGDTRTAPWDIGADQYAGDEPATTTTTTMAPPSTGNIHCVRPGITHNGDGSTWAAATSEDGIGAFNKIPDTLVRGDTYYLADGDYVPYVFNDALDGTKYIYIKKATASDHGIDTGWSYQYGDDQAVFAAGTGQNAIVISSNYWDIDGITGDNDTGEQYGIKLTMQADSGDGTVFMSNTSYINLKHLDIEDIGLDIDKKGHCIYANNLTGGISQNVSYCYIHDSATSNILTRGTTYSTFEHNYIARNSSSPTQHGTGWSCGNSSNIIFRYNKFVDIEGTSYITPSVASLVNWEIYGNVFMYTAANSAKREGVSFILGADTSGVVTNCKIYNNTFVRIPSLNVAFRADAGSSGNSAYNNLWVGCTDLTGGAPTYTFTNYTHDYNAFSGTSTNGETNGQANVATSIFTDYANNVYTLASATEAGTALSAPYNIDSVLNVRGADGTWDRGAYEYVAGGVTTTTTTAATTTSVSTTTTTAATTTSVSTTTTTAAATTTSVSTTTTTVVTTTTSIAVPAPAPPTWAARRDRVRARRNHTPLMEWRGF